MHDLVDVVGGDTRFGGASSDIQDFTREPADLAHTILLLLCEDLDPVPADEYLSRCQLPSTSVAYSWHAPARSSGFRVRRSRGA